MNQQRGELAGQPWLRKARLTALRKEADLVDVALVLIATPLILAGLGWLLVRTASPTTRAHEWILLSVFLLALLLQRFDFTIFAEIRVGHLATYKGSFARVVIWSAALLLGPIALWTAVIPLLLGTLWNAREYRSSAATRWTLARNVALGLAEILVIDQAALLFYRYAGGTFPLAGFTAGALVPALQATLLRLLLSRLLWLPIFVYWAQSRELGLRTHRASLWVYLAYAASFLLWPLLVEPFAIFAAALYSETGFAAYLVFNTGLLFASILAHELGKSAEGSRQRFRELERLEQLGRAFIGAPPNNASLRDILATYVPAIFPNCHVEIRIFPATTLLRHPQNVDPVPKELWQWAGSLESAYVVRAGSTPPWGADSLSRPVIIVPIQAVTEEQTIGAIYLCLPHSGVGPIHQLLPAAQTLASQTASALHAAKLYEQRLVHQRTEQELALAGKIQSSFLPNTLPELHGWQLAVWYAPARHTSGDFFDWIALPGGRLGLVIADVSDKGLGAALFMALTRTLIRTYAEEYPCNPEHVVAATNRRILTDTHSTMFVTLFYAILDPAESTLTYCNAGHNPPLLLRNGSAEPLPATGLPLGIVDEIDWEQKTVRLSSGDMLLLYTDGIIDAQNDDQSFFGTERLLEVTNASDVESAQALQQALVTQVFDWMGDAPQWDDMTLLVVERTS